MDKSLIRRRFSKAVPTYIQKANVQLEVAHRMSQLVKTYIPSCERQRVVEIGCGTGAFTRAYLSDESPKTLLLNDLCPEVKSSLDDLMSGQVIFCPGDAERMEFPVNQDLFVSCSAIQWFDSPEDFFVKCFHRLRDGGCWAFTTFGPRNLEEVAQLTSVSLPYRSQHQLIGELSSRYQILYSDEEIRRLVFESPMEVLKHLKETGVTGIGGHAWTRNRLAEFCSDYERRFSLPEGGVSLTYHPIYVIAKKNAGKSIKK